MEAGLAASVSLVWKTLAAAGIIIAAGRLARSAGPVLTGVLIALPVNAAPGLFFVALGLDSDFVRISVIYCMAGAGPVLVYLTAFTQAARLGRFFPALAFGLAGWFLGAVLIAGQELDVATGLSCVAGGAAIAILFSHAPSRRLKQVTAPASWRYLLIRGGVAGVLIAGAATFAPVIGPVVAGLILSFPTSLAVSGWALNGHYGLAFVAATYAAARKAISLYVLFCLIALGFLQWLPAAAAILAAFVVVALIGGLFAYVFLRWRSGQAAA